MMTPRKLFKNVGRKLTSNAGFRQRLCWLAACYMRLIWKTSPWEVIGREHPEKLWNEGKPFIVAFWHSRLLMMPYAWISDRPFSMLISQHRDGLLIAGTVAHFGIMTIAGSTTHGASQALRQILKAIKTGTTIGITPDGPKGPYMRASEGVIGIARAAGVPILPLTYSNSRGKILRTWDRFLVPKSFAKGIFIWGAPLWVPKETDQEGMEGLRAQLEASMNAITVEADRRMGIGPVHPPPLQVAGAAS